MVGEEERAANEGRHRLGLGAAQSFSTRTLFVVLTNVLTNCLVFKFGMAGSTSSPAAQAAWPPHFFFFF